MLKSISSITNAIGALNYKGTWNASTNTPTIVSSVGVKGDYYVVSVAGTTNINGVSNWGVGDWITFNGSVWQRVEGGADLNGVNLTFTGTASGPTYETSNAAKGLTITNNEIDADGTDTNIDVLIDPKGTGGVGIGGDPTGVVAGNTITSKFCVKHDATGQTGGFVHANNTTADSGAGIFACRSRGTIASPTVVQSGDRLATFSFAGNDGTDLALAAQINVEVDGAPGAGDMPGRIRFLTTPDGTETPVERVRVRSDGFVNIGTAANNTLDQVGAARTLVVQSSDASTTVGGSSNAVVICNSNTTTNNSSQLNFAAITGASTNQYSSAIISCIYGARTNAQYPTGELVFSTSSALNSAPTEKLRISAGGNLIAAGVYSATVGGTNRDVFVDNTGLIGYVPSIREAKTEIQDITDVLWLCDLNPVSFKYRKKDADGNYTEEADGSIEFGLIAEDTEQIKPELCFYDEVDGEQVLRGISYSKLVTPLLKLVQQQQSAIEQLTHRVSELESKGS